MGVGWEGAAGVSLEVTNLGLGTLEVELVIFDTRHPEVAPSGCLGYGVQLGVVA